VPILDAILEIAIQYQPTMLLEEIVGINNKMPEVQSSPSSKYYHFEKNPSSSDERESKNNETVPGTIEPPKDLTLPDLIVKSPKRHHKDSSPIQCQEKQATPEFSTNIAPNTDSTTALLSPEKQEQQQQQQATISTKRTISIASSMASPCEARQQNKTDQNDEDDHDTNDLIASIAVTAVSGVETFNGIASDPSFTVRPKDEINPDHESSSNVDDTNGVTGGKEQREAHSKQEKETAIHTRDIKMTDDDTLLGDVPWTMAQHKAFVAAIFEVGLKTCSPSVIMENMRKQPRYVTRERTKSHLQKYRITKDRNKDDFMTEYTEFMKKTESIKKQYIETTKREPIPKVILTKALEGKKATKLIGGQAAALLSFSVLNNCSTDHGPDQIPFHGTKTSFPALTEDEKQTSLGASLLYIKGLLHNMTDVLLKERHGLTNVPKVDVEEYDSQSSSEEEDFSDYEDDDGKPAASSNALRKPSPLPEDSTGERHHSRKLPPHGTYGYHGPYQGGAHTQFPPPPPYPRQGPPGFHPPFPPFAFGGPQRPMPPPHGPFPPHHPHHFNQGPYGHPMNQYPPGPGQPFPYPGPADVPHSTYPHQPVHHQYNDGTYPNHYPNVEPYPDMQQHDHYENSQDPHRTRDKVERPDRASSKNIGLGTKRRHKQLDVDLDLGLDDSHSDDMFRKEKRNRSVPDDPSLFASPLVADRKRKRREKRGEHIAPLDVSLEVEEDRGIPGASKVASPFHQRPSPVRPKVRSRHRDGSRQDKDIPKRRRSQSPLFMESPFKEVYESIKNEERIATSSFKDTAQPKTPMSSNHRSPEKTLSPDMLFAGEPHLSPGDMSLVSKMSNDGHQLVWEPLTIDMQEHLMDQERFRPPSSDADVKNGASTRSSKGNSSSDIIKDRIKNASPDSPKSTSKRMFFPEES
jgi:SHAQKYF class myb-like DNA-binding protein